MLTGFWFGWRAINDDEGYIVAGFFIALALAGLWSIGTFDKVFSRLSKREKTLPSDSDDMGK